MLLPIRAFDSELASFVALGDNDEGLDRPNIFFALPGDAGDDLLLVSDKL